MNGCLMHGGRRRLAARSFACWLLLPGVAAAQSTWFAAGSSSVRIVGPQSVHLRGPRPEPVSLPAGEYRVHFGTDAGGKPRSLAFAVGERATVRVAVAPAAAAEVTEAPLTGPEWTEVAGGSGATGAAWRARCRVVATTDYRVNAEYVAGATGAFGLVARWLDARQHYRFVQDRDRDEVRLERQFGDDVLVLARAAAPAADAATHTMALQVDGFRIEAYLDDELVLTALDGAFMAGAFGMWSAGVGAAWQRSSVEPVAQPRTSTALVVEGAMASLHASTTVSPGQLHVLEFATDRPHPALPASPAGFEPCVLQLHPAAPRLLLADPRQALGPVIGEVPLGGTFARRFGWPAGLGKHAALVRAVIVSPDGAAIVERCPWLPLVF